MTTIDRILVPTDFSEPARHALRYASDLGRRLRSSLVVMYADTFLPPVDYANEFGVWADTNVPALEAEMKKKLAGEINTYVDSTVAASDVVCVASPAAGILEQAIKSHADLIVMGTHGRSGMPRIVFGSVTEEVMRRATVPVLAVPPNTTASASFHSIVWPAQENPRGREVLRLAARLAPADAQFYIVGSTPDEVIDTNQAVSALQQWTPPELRSRCRFMALSDGHLSSKVAHLAVNLHADLIVATEPATRGVVDLMQGTFAERLMQRAGCPVLTLNQLVTAAAPEMTLQPA